MFTALPSLVRALVVVGSSLDMVSACVAVSVFADVMCVCVCCSLDSHTLHFSLRSVEDVCGCGRARGKEKGSEEKGAKLVERVV